MPSKQEEFIAEYCSDGRYAVRRTTWVNQDQYRPKAGKTVGVGFDPDLARNQNYLAQFGASTCLNGIGIVDNLKAMGYSASNIIVGIPSIGWQSVVNSALTKGVTKFYIDEPIQKNNPPSDPRIQAVQQSGPYIGQRQGQLYISESYFNYYGWYTFGDRGYIGAMIDLALSIQPNPLVSCHTHFEHYWYGTIDPRDQWSYIYQRVPNLFKLAWIKTRQSYSEMGLLFGHANNTGLSRLLFYPFDRDGVTYIGKVAQASDQGWRHGWLERLQREREDKWCCLTPVFYPDECYLESWFYTGNERWV